MFRNFGQGLIPALLVAAGSALAHDALHGPATPASPPDEGSTAWQARNPKDRAARIFFSDRRLVTQRGDEVAFYSDVLRGKVVLVHFIYTQCTDACPTQTARVAEVRSLLGARLGHGMTLVSISVDPEHDTPAVLRDYAERFGASEGWLFLTGRKTDVDDVLRRFAQLTATREAHTTLFILGNVTTGHWIKVHPDASPADIAQRLASLGAESADRADDSHP